MTVKERSVKQRVLKRIEAMDLEALLELEQELDEREKQARIERQLKALKDVTGILSDPEEYAEFEKYARRRPWFGGRTLDLAPDAPAVDGEP